MSFRLSRAAAWAAALLPAWAAAAPLTLDHALELAVQRSEAARAARAGAASALQSARAASQLPDPVLALGVDNLPVTGADRFSTTREAMTMKRVGISQEWVSAGKRSARQAAADALAARETSASRIADADVRLQASLAWLDAYYAGEALKLAVVNEHHAHEELESAKGLLASPGGNTQQVLALTSARGLAEDESADMRQQQAAAQVALQRWVGTAADELAAPGAWADVDEKDYVANHPSVVAAQRELDMARQDAAVAATNRTPDWTWGIAYQQRTGASDMVSFGVSIPLPVAPAQRQDRETAAKLALVDKAEAALAEAMRTAAAEHRALAIEAQRLAERVERYGTAVTTPAQQRTAVALAAYRSNQVPLMTLFEARHAELEAQRKLLALRRDLAKARAQLAFRPLPAGDVR